MSNIIITSESGDSQKTDKITIGKGHGCIELI